MYIIKIRLLTNLNACFLLVPLDKSAVVVGAFSVGGEGSHHLDDRGGDGSRGLHATGGINGILQVLDVQVDAEPGFEISLQH